MVDGWWLAALGKRREICIASHRKRLTSEVHRHGSHMFYTANTPCLPSPRKRSPEGATTDINSSHLIAAYYSFIDPKRMKGWVGLDSWPTADDLPYKWSHISCRSGAGHIVHNERADTSNQNDVKDSEHSHRTCRNKCERTLKALHQSQIWFLGASSNMHIMAKRDWVDMWRCTNATHSVWKGLYFWPLTSLRLCQH